MSLINKRIGSTLREEREKRGLSQEALAELADMNRGFLGEIERGEAIPSFVTIEKLAAALGMRISDLMKKYEQD